MNLRNQVMMTTSVMTTKISRVHQMFLMLALRRWLMIPPVLCKPTNKIVSVSLSLLNDGWHPEGRTMWHTYGIIKYLTQILC
ncbi:hypothetical protein ANCCAN_04439 [Ancylostoma caninum]|uniref:Uncharacterized protein n=1 Tax=Ancylostoma caninum TaxID=29170 RepID=A0A368H144_ANCCA|nr:hypothetical protein ANCCAN_04439 [Ancylostoma caninum]